MGAAPVTITRTRPPRDSYRRGRGKVCPEPINFRCSCSRAEGYLHFVEDEFVPQAVVPDDAILHLRELSVHGEVQQPLLERGCGAALNLRGGGGGSRLE